MKKGIIISGIIGIIIIATTMILVSNVLDFKNGDIIIVTGNPAENYPEIDRDKFCGTGDAQSNNYIKEFRIPTECTQPQAIVTSPDGHVWFAQSNTGKLAKFDPNTESFSEYENKFWPRGDRSMIWGLDYASDGTLWFTDDDHNSIWKFDIATKEYQRVPNFVFNENSIPQRILADGSRIIVNDFTGNQIIYFDNVHSFDDLVTYSLPSIAPEAVTADFTLDSQNNLWYTNWILDSGGILAKLNQTSIEKSIQNNMDSMEIFMYDLPRDLKTANGIATDVYGNIWLADSSSSLFFKFDPLSENYTKYVTSNPTPLTYGNHTGKVESPYTSPYWIDTFFDKIAFNEPSANRIAIFDPLQETLVEYTIPSKNHYWGDCGEDKNCGISQVFDFTVDGNKIWFTEWAENNIGVLDTSILLPIDVQTNKNKISLKPGESKDLIFTISSNSQSQLQVYPIISNPDFGQNLSLISNSNEKYLLDPEIPLEVSIIISAIENASPGEYKILIGAGLDSLALSKFITITIE
jgi:virginiamycin B lyase